MGGRWKRQRSGKRAHLKRFSSEVVNAGKTANSLVLKEYRSRANTLATPPAKANYSQNEEHYNPRRSLTLLPAEAIVSDAFKELWQTGFWQGYDHHMRVNLIVDPARGNLFLFVSRDRYYFVKETPNRSQRWGVERSVIYPTKDIAMRHYRSATICWVKKRDVGQSILEKTVGPKLDLEPI